MAEQVKTGNYKPIKNLPKNEAGQFTWESFTANGNKYHFIRPGSEIGIKKWTEYEKLKIVVGTGQTFENIVAGHNEMNALLGGDKPFASIRTEAILLNDAYKKAILDMSRDRFNKAFYLCSIFVYRDGDDPYTWSLERAEDYITDWVEERISEQDFFLFCAILIPSFNQVFSELNAQAQAQAERLLAVTG